MTKLKCICFLILMEAILFISSSGSSTVVEFTLRDETIRQTVLGNVYEKWKGNTGSINNDSIPVYTTYVNPSGYGEIDTKMNFIITRDIDRDTLCMDVSCCHLLQCVIELECHMFQGMKRESISIRLIVNDENDNAPFFEPFTSLDLVESLSVGDTYNLPKANDRDSVNNGVVRYQLIDTSRTFTILQETLNEGSTSVSAKLKVLKPLDRETRAIYVVRLEAIDGGIPARTGTLSFTIRLVDVNDEIPTFSKTHDTIYVPENTRKEELLYHFNASDRDEGVNGRITYEISRHSIPPNAEKKFYIEPLSGMLMLQETLDYEKREERRFELRVVAEDQGSPKHSSTCTLTIIVKDDNDNDPIVIEKESKLLPENDATSILVKAFGISDNDEISRERINCSLANEPASRGFALQHYSKTFMGLSNTMAFDYERQQVLNPRIICVDAAPTPRTISIVVRVQIEDRNDNSPYFTKGVDEKVISEDTPVNSVLFVLQAFDDDSGDYGRVRYNFTSAGDPTWSDYISINAEDGEVRLRYQLDREAIPEMHFYVQATDCDPIRPQHNQTLMKLIVGDVNDNAPICEIYPPERFEIAENSPVDTLIGQIICTDPDAAENGTVLLRLETIPGDSYSVEMSSFFHIIDHKSLVLRKPLDREKIPNVSLLAIAFDGGVVSQESSIPIRIHVTDVNDNAPILIKPMNGSIIGSTLPIPQSAAPGTPVTSLRARDEDSGENGTVLFSILFVNDTTFENSININNHLLFIIDPMTNVLTTNWSMNHVPHPAVYAVVIQLTDMGNPPLSSEAILFVNISVGEVENSVFLQLFHEFYPSNLIILISIVLLSFILILVLLSGIFWIRCRLHETSTSNSRIHKFHNYHQSQSTNNLSHQTPSCRSNVMSPPPYDVCTFKLDSDEHSVPLQQTSYSTSCTPHQLYFYQSADNESNPLKTYLTNDYTYSASMDPTDQMGTLYSKYQTATLLREPGKSSNHPIMETPEAIFHDQTIPMMSGNQFQAYTYSDYGTNRNPLSTYRMTSRIPLKSNLNEEDRTLRYPINSDYRTNSPLYHVGINENLPMTTLMSLTSHNQPSGISRPNVTVTEPSPSITTFSVHPLNMAVRYSDLSSHADSGKGGSLEDMQTHPHSQASRMTSALVSVSNNPTAGNHVIVKPTIRHPMTGMENKDKQVNSVVTCESVC